MAKPTKQQEYLTRLEIATGHRIFGPLSPRKQPKEKDEDEGGAGTAGLLADQKQHPLFADAAQFSGDLDIENPVIQDNPDGKKELELSLANKLEKKQQAEKHFNPSPLINR
jgi:hypothetical protein